MGLSDESLLALQRKAVPWEPDEHKNKQNDSVTYTNDRKK